MKVGDVIETLGKTKKRRVIVGRTPGGEWVVKPLNGYVLDILSPAAVAKNWVVVEDGCSRA